MTEKLDVRICLIGRDDLLTLYGFMRKPEILRGTLQLPYLQIGWMGRWFHDSDG